jgi:hypothetical protein
VAGSADLVRLADVELLLTKYLTAELADTATVGLVAPVGNDILPFLPFVRVARRGGPRDHLTRIDRPSIDIDVWDTTNGKVNEIGELAAGLVAASLGLTDPDLRCSITRVEVGGPQRLPEEDPKIVRLGFAVGLTVRSLV